MANHSKKNTRNDKRGKPANAARPEATKPGAQTQPRMEIPNRSPSQEQVAKRAYQIFQARGGDHGRHVEDWEQAERELKLGT